MHRKKRANIRCTPAACLVRCLLCGCIVVAAAYAQEIASSNGTPVRVHGVVLNAVTRAPIRRALVSSVDQHMAVMTDDKGRFEFEVKSPASRASTNDAVLSGFYGNVFISARKPGYLPQEMQTEVPISDQDALKAELRMQLMPEATIMGTVSSSSAEPLSGLLVQLLHRQVQDGTAIWQPAQSIQVDARGRFRFGALMPGQYKVITAEWIDRVGPLATVSDKPMIGYPPQAYPNGTTPATAGIIHLGGGQSVAADVTLRAARYYTVDLPVRSDSVATVVGVTVASDSGSGYGLGFNGQPPHVEGALPDGIYHVTVTQSGGSNQQGPLQSILVGTQELTIAGKPVHGPTISPLHGATIPISVREEYTRPDPNDQSTVVTSGPVPDRVLTGAVPLQSTDVQEGTDGKVAPQNPPAPPPRVVDVSLTPVDDVIGMVSSNQQDDPGGGTSLANVSPGKYKILANARRGYVASITANGVDLLREPLVIESGAASPALEIVLRDDYATITGAIPAAFLKAASLSSPLLVMAYPIGDEGGARPVGGLIEAGGKFTISAAVPGTYLVLASQGQAANLEFRNKKAMKAFESRGVTVSLSPGQTQSIELKDVVTIAEEADAEEAN